MDHFEREAQNHLWRSSGDWMNPDLRCTLTEAYVGNRSTIGCPLDAGGLVHCRGERQGLFYPATFRADQCKVRRTLVRIRFFIDVEKCNPAPIRRERRMLRWFLRKLYGATIQQTRLPQCRILARTRSSVDCPSTVATTCNVR